MTILYRLLMAGAVLNLASLPMAGAAPATSDALARPILLAQQQQQQEQKQQEAPKRPAPPPPRPAAPPPPAARPPQPPAPPPPVQHAPPPPPVQHAPPPPRQPAPPAVQRAPNVVPPAAQQAPIRPPAAQIPAPPATQTPPRPPAAQITPRPVAPAQGQPPAPTITAPTHPQAPPAAQRVPNVMPPAAQGLPPAGVRPVMPPTAQSPQPPAQGAPAGAGVAPNLQTVPLQRSGVPAPTAQQAHPIAPAAIGAGIAPTSAQGQPLHRMNELRAERRQTTEGNRIIIREPDRTIIREGGQTVIRHNELDRFRYGARDVRMERRGNDNLTFVVRPDGSRVVTVLDADGFLIRRSRILPNGQEIIIIDNRPRGPGFRPGGGYGGFFVDLPPPIIRIPQDRYIVDDDDASPEILYETLLAPPVDLIERPYSLDEIRYSAPLRDRMPRIDLNTVNFDTGSWELSPGQIEKLAALADSLNRAIARNPREVFLIEGHTDAVGNDVDNLSLSDRRAESVAIVLTQQFGVPPENLTTQGYGAQYLKIPTPGPERANRRVTVRRITPLLSGQAQ